MSYCGACGVSIGDDAFCTQCGQSRDPGATGGAGSPSFGPASGSQPSVAATAASGDLVTRLRGLPVELQAVCGLMAGSGVLLLGLVLFGLSGVWDAFRIGGGFWVFGLLLLVGIVVVAAAGAALLLLAWRMTNGDRVARGLSYVVLGSVAGALIVGDDHRATVILVIVASLAALGLLALSPNVNQFFRDYPISGQEAVSVVVARTLVAAWAALVVLNGVVLALLGKFDSKFVLIGLLLVAVGIGAFVVNGRLADGDRRARIIVSAAAAANVVLLFGADQWTSASLLPLALSIGVVGFLWIPTDSRMQFGDTVAETPLQD